MSGFRSIAVALSLALAFSSASAQQTYGVGSVGAGGITPTICSNQAWMGNLAWGVQISGGVGGTPGLLLMGPAAANTQLGPYPIYVDLPSSLPLIPFVTSGVPGAAGVGEWFLPIPLAIAENPALAGLGFFYQGAILDPAGPGGAALTSGLATELVMTPRVFVASSVGGSSDPWSLIDPLTMSVVASGGSSFTNNVKGALFSGAGTRLYAESSFTGLAVANINSAGPLSWSSLSPWAASAGISSRAIQEAKAQRLLWGIGDPGIGSTQLTAMDSDPASPSYGSALFNTTDLSTNFVGTWALSRDGTLGCVPSLLGGSIRVWDLDPQSPSFLGLVDVYEPGIPIPLPQTTIPTGSGGSFWANNSVAFTPDNSQVLILRQGTGSTPSEIARYSFLLGGWIDHNPGLAGIQNLGPNSAPPVVLGSAGTSLSMAKDGSFVVVSGFGGNGWCGRVDIDINNPSFFSYTPATGTNFANAWRSSISPDGDRVAVASGAPFRLNFLDAATMNFIASAPLNMGSATNVVWR